ncbi:hypothetical protein HK096_009853, partial [Nowakowskiella sp. JEL0078]
MKTDFNNEDGIKKQQFLEIRSRDEDNDMSKTLNWSIEEEKSKIMLENGMCTFNEQENWKLKKEKVAHLMNAAELNGRISMSSITGFLDVKNSREELFDDSQAIKKKKVKSGKNGSNNNGKKAKAKSVRKASTS